MWGSVRPKNLEMYEAYLEFLEGWGGGGVLQKNPFRGWLVWIFSEITLKSTSKEMSDKFGCLPLLKFKTEFERTP